eukprot:GHRR01028203.1.p1 GENE.GHRR01028203.1~~GHRR01028203.1.p1  ORF type:complete len:523 (+),score=159.45 GHRR01028203.1:586-2154(+)
MAAEQRGWKATASSNKGWVPCHSAANTPCSTTQYTGSLMLLLLLLCDFCRQPKRQLAIVLCPNAALCQQVVRLVSSLQSPSGEPLLRACQVASSNPPPFEPPDVVVTTPGALVNLFNDRGFSYGSQWTAEGVSSRARFVVVDEADLLSQGGYVKDLMRLLDAFKAGERRVIESQVMEELGLSEDDIRRLPRHIRQACWDAGVPGMLKAGYKVRTQQQQLEQPADKVPMWSEDMKQQATVQDQLATGSNSTEDGSSSDPFVKRRASSSQASSRGHSSYGPYFRRQYLLVAATMPALTKGDVGVALQKRFKEAAWVSGDMLHQIKPHVQHQWVKVGEQGTEDALVQALQNDSDYQAQKARVLIFAKDTTAADNVSGMLQGHGIHHVVYHKNVSKEDRDAALAAMSQASEQTGNTVMVSTDAAARGIDLPDITHVLQADFAATAIEFLHRVGRTARAGKPGKVTSMYGRSDAVLAEALQQYIQEGRPIQDCFSRNRSFSRKVKRYGKFVPRGQEGPQKGKASVTA